MTPTAASGLSTIKKAVARAALVNVDEASSAVLHDSFRQFGIQTVALGADFAQRLQKEKFEALVLRLNDEAVEVLEAARNSPSNRRVVIYGIAATSKQALRYSKYGVNSVLGDPVERQSALRVVRATHLLVVHELRRYVRIPIVIQIAMNTETRRLVAHTQEISGGGMSVRASAKLAIGQPVEVVFDLPKRPGIKIASTVCWVRDMDGLAGLRFNADDQRRLPVKDWIEDYLDIS